MQENNFRVNQHSLKTAISRVEKDKIITRGYNQRDLIEKIRYSDMIYLLLKGRLPSVKEGKIFNHVFVSLCDVKVQNTNGRCFIRLTNKLCCCRGIIVFWT